VKEFRSALAQYLIGDLEVSDLEDAIDQAMAEGPDSEPQLKELLDDLFQSGRLPHQIYALLKRHIEQGARPAAGGGERTEFQPPSGDMSGEEITEVPEPADATRIAPAAPPPESSPESPPESDDATRIAVGPPEGTGTFATGQTGGQTGPLTGQTGTTTGQTGAPTGQPTGQSGWSAQSRPTGTSGSNWSHPSQWSGAGTGESQVVEIGSVIKGRFVLEKLLGQGGMGRVFKALDARKQEAQDRHPYVAVKILNEDFKQHPHALQALQRESRKAQDLAHPNVATVFDFDRDGDNVFMTMEILEGESLDKFVKRHLRGGVPFDKAIGIIKDLADGLTYAHAKGVVHSDFKPANAFLTSGGQAKIFDFGIARAAKGQVDAEGEKTLFDAGELGALTPAYASCEMIEGQDPDARDDIYALAIVAYELLTGRHPYDKKSAVVARDSGMTLEPVKGLTRKQWRGLQRGLAFSREDRSPSVEAFMAELNPKTMSRALVAGMAAGVVILSGVAYVLIPQFLAQQEVSSLIADIGSGSDDVITSRLSDLQDIRGRDASLFRDVFADGGIQDRFIDYYTRRIRAVWNPADERFQYPEAEVLIAELEDYFSDSQKVGDLQEEILSEREEKIAQLYGELTGLLDGGVMIPEQGEENVTAVIGTLSQINPQNERLSQGDIPIRFAEEAARLQQTGELELAELVLAQGLVIAPGDIALVNVRDAITSQRDQVAMENRIAELESQLSATQPQDADTQGIRQAAAELAVLEPGNSTLVNLRDRTRSYLAENLDTLEASGDFGGARTLLVSYEGVADEAFLAERSGRLDRVAEENRVRIDSLFASLQQAVDSDRLDTGPDNARALLDQLTSLAATNGLLADARNQIASGYSRRATRAQQNGQWDEAREQLRAGIAMNPSTSTLAQLEGRLLDVDRNEQQAEQIAAEDRERLLAEQRQQEIDNLQGRFNAILTRGDFGAADAREALATVQDLAAYEIELPNGRQRIADRLIQSVNDLLSRGEFDQAGELAGLGGQILPQQQEFGALVARVNDERTARSAEIERRRLDDLETLIADLLANAMLDQAWDQSIGKALIDYGAIVGEGSRELNARRTRVAELYAEDAQRQRENSRLVNAGQQLTKAERYAPDLPLIEQERAALALQETLLAEQTAERAREAEINNQKLALEADAKAGNMDSAVALLGQLRNTIPNDPFVTDTGPARIAAGYAALGLKEVASSGGLQDAGKLLAAAREWSTSVPEVVELAQTIDEQADSTFAKVGEVMAGDQPLNVPVISRMVDAIRSAAPEVYAAREPEVVENVLAKIDQLGSQLSVAQRRLDEARGIFPDNELLKAKEIGGAVAVGGDPCARPDLVGNGGRRGGSCRDPLPGGNRGPALVVLPAGGPFSSAVAISKFEITIRDYNIYCEQSGNCPPKSGDPKLPLTQISVQEAERFVDWMGEASGATYRIPNSNEWEYAATANGSQPKRNWNCRVSQNNVLLKGIDLVPVDTGEGNGWGLYNYVGNAREWVREGAGWEVRGGAFENPLDQCDIRLSTSHDGTPDRLTGFRVLRELG
jgi:serine/threonine protein kinase